MREPRSKQVTFVVQKDLCLVNKPPKRRGVNDPIPVTLVLSARGRRRFVNQPAPTRRRVAGIGSKVKILIQNAH